MMRNQGLAVAAKVVAALCFVGCASPQKVLMERTSSLVVYDLPAMEVMKAAEVVLGERGYTLIPSTDPYFLQTTWVTTGNFDMGTRWSRLFVEGRVRADGRFSVRAYEMAATTFARTQALPTALISTTSGFIDDVPNGSPTVLLSEPELQARSARAAVHRELDLEWDILERVNPAFAERVKEQVDRYVASAPQ